VTQVRLQLREELGVVAVTFVGDPQLLDRSHQGLRDEAPSKHPEVTSLVG
jgi:hypothetical protein